MQGERLPDRQADVVQPGLVRAVASVAARREMDFTRTCKDVGPTKRRTSHTRLRGLRVHLWVEKAVAEALPLLAKRLEPML